MNTNYNYDQLMRLSWQAGSFCSIWSRSKNQWFEAQIEEIKGELSDEWLIVRYQSFRNNKHYTHKKTIQRNNKSIKPLPAEHILSLDVGSFCLIYSTVLHIWCKGKVIEIFNDADGEWLSIKYTQNHKIVVTEIQRFSKDLKPWKPSSDIDQKRFFDLQLITAIARKHTSLTSATQELSAKLPFTKQFNQDLAKNILIHILKQDNNNEIKHQYNDYENGQKQNEEKIPEEKHEMHQEIAAPVVATSNKQSNGTSNEYDWNEIKKHNTQTDLWLVYANKVFDITSFLRFHPGGIDVILQIAAKTQDITNIFQKLNHPPVTNKIITKHYIGNVCQKTPYERVSLDLSAMKLGPIWNEKDKNLNINVDEEMNEAVMVLRDHYVIQWSDLFTVKVMIIDKQHESLINVMNKIYESQEIKYLMDLLKRWDTHCKTEETLFEYYQFDEKAAMEHLQDHKVIYHQIKDQMTFCRIKYNDQQTKAKELSEFAAKVSSRFVSHHHAHDIKYVDHLDKAILNDV